jgi:hypothetical protein
MRSSVSTRVTPALDDEQKRRSTPLLRDETSGLPLLD